MKHSRWILCLAGLGGLLIATGAFAPPATAVSLSAGDAFSMLIRADGSLVSWGSNDSGQTGTGKASDWPQRVGRARDWQVVSCGFAYTMALKTDGSLWGWGLNGNGQLGMATGSLKTPTRVGTAADWKQISAGGQFTLALKTDGSLWSWGANGKGQLGLGPADTGDKTTPVRIGSDTDWTQVSAGYDYALAVKTDGTLWVWGANDYGQLGLGTSGATSGVRIPTKLGTANDWSSATAAGRSSFGIKADGLLWSWGMNNVGQLGLGDEIDRSSPILVDPAQHWKTVIGAVYGGLDYGGVGHALALRQDDALWGCGENTWGQVGIGRTGEVRSFTRVGAAAKWVAAAAGRNASFALDTTGTVWSWGDGLSGHLGIGNALERRVPTTYGMNVHDLGGPSTWAGGAVTAYKGAKATLRFRARDAVSKAAAISIVIRNAKGKQVKLVQPKRYLTGRIYGYTFPCKLKRGSYRYSIYAVDASGNPQKKVAVAKLTVR